jgi:hypothetical protein
MTSYQNAHLTTFRLLGELSLFVRVDLNTQPASLTFNDMNGPAVTGADLIEHSLTSDPELASGLVEFEIASWDLRDEPLADLVGD